jgi:hypothetical protein
MSHNRSRAMLVGLGAAVGAFGAAATMAAAIAPTARADDLTEILSAVNVDFSQGQADFTSALSNFGVNQVSAGLAAIDDGVDQYLVAAPDNLLVGGIEALNGEPITGPLIFSVVPVTTFADALNQAELAITGSGSDFTTAATELSMGDYGLAAFYDVIGLDAISVLPLEYVLLGAGI